MVQHWDNGLKLEVQELEQSRAGRPRGGIPREQIRKHGEQESELELTLSPKPVYQFSFMVV
jgi:hypothetical protein